MMRTGTPNKMGWLGGCRAVGAIWLLAALASPVAAMFQPPAIASAEAPASEPPAHGAEVRLPAPPTGGSVAELTAHRRSGVVSAWLENGVRVHHMWFAPPPGEEANPPQTGSAGVAAAVPGVIVTITVPGGVLQETTPTLGRSMAAAQAWSFPATRSVPAEAMARVLKERGIQVKAWAMADAMILRLQGTMAQKAQGAGRSAEQCCADQLEVALQAARLLLTEPVVTEEAVKAHREARSANLAEIRDDQRAAVSDQITALLLPPGDLRFRYSMEGETEPTGAQMQEWLDRVLGLDGKAPAPVEVAIVGQVKLDDAVLLAARYLGAMPKRERISSGLFRAERFPASVPAGAVECERVVVRSGAAGPQAGTTCVAVGFFGPTTIDFPDQRALNMGSVVLRIRAADSLRPILASRPAAEKSPNPWRMGAQAEPLQVWSLPGGAVPPGPGMVVAAVCVPPAEADAAGKLLREQIARLAAAPMEAAEFETFKATFLERLRAVVGQPGYWSEVLAASTYRGYRPDDLAAAEEMVSGFTAQDIQRVWAKYATPNRAIGVVLRP